MMTLTWKRRWLILGILWSIAAFLTYWNGNCMDEIAKIRMEHARLKSELQFQLKETNRLKQVENSAKALFFEVESLPLGVVSIRSGIAQMAEKSYLKVVAMIISTSQDPNGAFACHLSLAGSPKDVLRFVKTLENRPFFQTNKLQLKRANKGDDWTLEIDVLAYLKVIQKIEERNLAALANGPAESSGRNTNESLRQ
jgi:Tfp pilus assembly protein PilO